jgi:hypothetical protein
MLEAIYDSAISFLNDQASVRIGKEYFVINKSGLMIRKIEERKH